MAFKPEKKGLDYNGFDRYFRITKIAEGGHALRRHNFRENAKNETEANRNHRTHQRPANATAQAQVEQMDAPTIPGRLRSRTSTKPPGLGANATQVVYRAPSSNDRHAQGRKGMVQNGLKPPGSFSQNSYRYFCDGYLICELSQYFCRMLRIFIVVFDVV